jgi:hypothetical protein
LSYSRALLVACAAAALALPSAALAHQGNPNFLSQVKGTTPALRGLSIQVLNRDDRLLMKNTSGHTIVIEGYGKEPYARVAADGPVEVNTHSPAYYLNNDRYANATVPASAKPGAAPLWKPISKTGRFEWHDHRMHYMGKGRPSQVTDPKVRQKVFDWQVPVQVDGHRGSIDGDLLWTPLPKESLPLGAIFAFAALIIAGSIVVIVARRRRAPGAPADTTEAAEAW